MKILHELSKRRIHTAECDRLRIQIALLGYPSDSFGAALLVLSLAFIDLRIKLWRSVI